MNQRGYNIILSVAESFWPLKSNPQENELEEPGCGSVPQHWEPTRASPFGWPLAMAARLSFVGEVVGVWALLSLYRLFHWLSVGVTCKNRMGGPTLGPWVPKVGVQIMASPSFPCLPLPSSTFSSPSPFFLSPLTASLIFLLE